MKWTEMLECSPAALTSHYWNVRELAYNNANMACMTRPNSGPRRKLAHSMGYLTTQMSMCENAARRRGINMSASEDGEDGECAHESTTAANGHGSFCKFCGETLS